MAQLARRAKGQAVESPAIPAQGRGTDRGGAAGLPAQRADAPEVTATTAAPATDQPRRTRARGGRHGGRHKATAPASLSVRSLLRSNGEVRALLLAQGLSEIGDWISRVGLATVVLAVSQSVLLTAATFAISFLPAVFGGVLLGGLADRYPRRDVLLACDLVRALVVLWLAVGVARGLPVGVLLVLLGLAELFSAPFLAARSALLPDLVAEKRQYSTANSASRVLTMVTQVFGFVAAGLVVQLVGVRSALLVDAASFVLSMLLLTRVRRGTRSAVDSGVRPAVAEGQPTAEPGRFRAYVDELRAGARIVAGDPVRRSLVLLGWGSAVVLIAPEAVALAYAQEHGLSTFTGSVLMALTPAGAAVGAWLVGRLPPYAQVVLLLPLVGAASLPLLLTPLVSSLAPLGGAVSDPSAVAVTLGVSLLWLVSGACQGYMLPLIATVTLATAPAQRGLVNGLAGAGFSLATTAAFLVVGQLADSFGAAAAIGVAGGLGLVLVLVAWRLWPAQAVREGAATAWATTVS